MKKIISAKNIIRILIVILSYDNNHKDAEKSIIFNAKLLYIKRNKLVIKHI